MKKVYLFAAFAVLMFLSSCMTQRLVLREGDLKTPTYEANQTFFVGGIGQTQTLNVDDACKGKTPVAYETTMTFIDGLLGSITASIYTPLTVRVYCQ